VPGTLEPEYKPARNWSREKRFTEASKRVVHEDWSQARAATYYGVSRPRLNEHVAKYREKLEAQRQGARVPLAKGSEQIAAAIGPLGLNERRRVGTFDEFDRYYFGHWVCPDCEVHHEDPEFHTTLKRELQAHHPRMVINVPPYHAKSTLVTVKHTIYQVVQDPNHRTLIISKSLPFAKTFLHSINELLTNPELYQDGKSLIEDWGPFKPEGTSAVWNTERIYVAGRVSAEKDPTVQVVGVGGQVYGRRADTIKADDVADLKNQRNPELVQQMLQWFDQEVSNRIGKRGRLIWVGTRVHPGDIYSFLKMREGYFVMQWPAVLSDADELTLWPEHFDYLSAQLKKGEMTERDWQLVYQNIDTPGLGASFTQEMLDAAKDEERVVGHYESDWRLIAGLDLAGGNAGSGYTAGVLIGINLQTGKRYLVDAFNVKSMKAPQLKEQVLAWSEHYPIYEWRVENNGLQSQLVQYNEEIVRELALQGIRITPHNTSTNKWDEHFGVESMAPLCSAGLLSIPWGNQPSRRTFQPLIEQLIVFPMGVVTDLVMATWFADLGCRDLLKRAHLPLFDARRPVPSRIAKRRVVIDFANQQATPIPLYEQSGAVYAGPGSRGHRRLVTGRPSPHRDWVDPTPPEPIPFVNREGSVPS